MKVEDGCEGNKSSTLKVEDEVRALEAVRCVIATGVVGRSVGLYTYDMYP